jgi:diguanylate cyclase (GGDEF)-like protein
VIAIAAILIGGLGYDLVQTQSQSRAGVEADFARRAQLTANLTSAALSSVGGDPADERRQFGGAVGGLEQALRAAQAQDNTPAEALLDARGRLLAAVPSSILTSGDALALDPDVRRALRGGVTLSNVDFWGPTRLPVLLTSVPFDTRFGRRILVAVVPAHEIAVASSYIASAPGVRGASAYLLDGEGRVLASSTDAPQGAALANRALVTAAQTSQAGDLGPNYFVAAPVGAGSDWQVVFSVSRAALLRPISSSGSADWLTFAALVAAVLAFLAVCGLTVRKSGELVRAKERASAAHQLAQQRLHDPVTGLPSRELFLERAQRAIGRLDRSDSHVALLFVDIDHFKRINDSLGHAAGDELLRTFASRVKAAIGATDTVSRFGGDEFLILCEGLASADRVLTVAHRVSSALADPFRLGSRDLHLTCCIGVAIHQAGDPLVDAETLVRDADAAMYAAKGRGGGGVKVFDAELHAAALQRLDTEVALRDALREGQIRPHYQPIVVLEDGAICGVEALARWDRPGVGSVAPSEFIPAAEDCGLINEIGCWILACSMSDVERWFADRLVGPDFWLSVNVSPRQLCDPTFPDAVATLLSGWSLPPSALCLEITESVAAGEHDVALDALARLGKLGLRLALDDFGVGHSSLARLVRSLPLDVLKLDRAFVSALSQPREDAVVAAVAVMATALGINAVAEGVETEEQSTRLRSLGYKFAQGYHFGRPVDCERIREMLSQAGTRPDRSRLVLAA